VLPITCEKTAPVTGELVNGEEYGEGGKIRIEMQSRNEIGVKTARLKDRCFDNAIHHKFVEGRRREAGPAGLIKEGQPIVETIASVLKKKQSRIKVRKKSEGTILGSGTYKDGPKRTGTNQLGEKKLEETWEMSSGI